MGVNATLAEVIPKQAVVLVRGGARLTLNKSEW